MSFGIEFKLPFSLDRELDVALGDVAFLYQAMR
jgi:hypothetical protein